MEEADFLCDRIAIMDRGKFVARDAPGRLKDILGGDVVFLEIEGSADALVNRINNLDWIKNITRHGENLSLTMERGERRIPELINTAKENGVEVTCVHLRKPSLEDVFLHFTGKTMREEEATQAERNREILRRRFGRRR